MLRGIPLFVLFCGVILSNSRSFYSIGVPALDLSQLTRDSDFIVVGRIVSVVDTGEFVLSWQGRSIPARNKQAGLGHPQRTIKGQLATSLRTFKFVEPNVDLGFRQIRIGQFAMFFLKLDSSGAVAVTNPYYPFVISAPDAPTTQGGDFERVVGEVVNILASTKSSPDDQIRAIVTLRNVKTLAARGALRLATNSRNPTVRLQALATLLGQNDTSRLPLAERILIRGGMQAEEYLIGNVARALSQIRDPDAIPALTRLLDSRHPEARQSAAAAIRNTGGSAAIKPLMKALYDSDRNVRYQAVIGLAEITRQYSWGPSVETFSEDERRYLQYWRNWSKGR